MTEPPRNIVLSDEVACPHPDCGRVMAMHTSIHDPTELPEEGDFSICKYCLRIIVFVIRAASALFPKQISFRLPAPEERAEALEDDDIRAIATGEAV